MAEQTYATHRHRPWLFNIASFFWAIAVASVIMRSPGRWITMASELATLATLGVLIWMARSYAIRLQDRIILLEMKVRAAEMLPAGEDAKLAQLTKSQIIALRFASDAELSDLLDRAVRDKLSSKEIKMAIKSWKPDLLRT
ncbi:MAG: DUF6526 family protein [Vicinamibacterales bacterium]